MQESAFQDLFFGGLLRMLGSQFQQFNEDLNKMLGSTKKKSNLIWILDVNMKVKDSYVLSNIYT